MACARWTTPRTTKKTADKRKSLAFNAKCLVGFLCITLLPAVVVSQGLCDLEINQQNIILDIEESRGDCNQHAVFNSQSTIQVGGRWNRGKSRIDKPFLGIMSGLVVNGANIFKLAAEKDSRVSVKGDVQTLPIGGLTDRVGPLQRMQQTPPSGLPGVGDDLIFSGAGSGCAGDDEDEECTPIYDNGTDDLITPVYVAPTRSPSPSTPKSHEKMVPCDDEEECNEEGSGDSGTTEEIFVTSATDSSSSVVSYTTQRQLSTSQPISSTSTTVGTTSTSTVQTTATANASSSQPDSTRSSIVTHESTSSSSSSSTSQYTTISSTEMSELPPTSTRMTFYTVVTPKVMINDNQRIHSETSEYIALVIGIIAGALIAIILIILLILKFKGRPEVNYKIDDGKSFCQEPNAALLGAAGGGGGPGQPYNGALKNGQGGSRNGKNRQVKDIKEWYV